MNLLRLKVVLAAIDRDDTSLGVLDAARALAQASGAALHIVHVTPAPEVTEVPPDGDKPADVVASMLERANVPDDATTHVIAGEPAHAIRMLADRVRADVIALGAHRDRAGDRALGSTALAIATASWAPCLIVKQALRLPLERVLVPVDLSDTAHGAMMVALSWGSALRNVAEDSRGDAPTKLTALHVKSSESKPREDGGVSSGLDAEMERVRAEAGSWAGVDIDAATIASADIPDAIAKHAREMRADLMVLGTRGQGLDAVGRLGSVSEAVMRRAEVPVLLVPPAVWQQFSERHNTPPTPVDP